MNQYIDISNLSPENLETYNRDPEAFMGWLDTVMGGGPQFILDSLPMAIEARPAYRPERDNSAPYVEPKWHKSRSGGYGGSYAAQEQARKRKRLDKRATTKANRKRARNSK